MWAPTTATWGVENRTTALRVIPGSAKSQRVEVRVGPADANPYLALAASLAMGLRGIEEGLDLAPPVVGNAYASPPEAAPKLPSSLEEATDLLDRSRVMRELLGDRFVDHFVATRRWEVREFRKHVSDWELARYFEII
jgi:glutamine synthetase